VSNGQLLCIAAIGAFVLAIAPRAGWAVAFVGAYLITLGGVTTKLLTVASGPAVNGIAPSTLTIYLSDVLLVCSVVAIWAQNGRLKIGWTVAAFLLPATVLLFTAWGNDPAQWSGIKLYLTAIISFAIGRWLSTNLTEKGALALASACAVICGLQFLLTVAQSAGIMLIHAGRQDSGEWVREGRMVGLYVHPGIVGKTIFLLFCFLLPLTSSANAATRRLAYTALTLGSVTILLTLSRANAVALTAAVVIWVIFTGRATSIVNRLAIVGGVAAIIVVSTNAAQGLQDREAQDPNGGYRDPIFAVGMNQIQSQPLTGTGPNYYLQAVSQYDHYAAEGWPLHNTFLLAIAELGIPLAIVFFSPLLMAIGSAAKRTVQTKKLDPTSVALLAVLPGVITIGWTGWGLLSSESVPLWFMGFGFLACHNSRVTTTSSGSDEDDETLTDAPIRAAG
jgi:O-antigen ligase